MLKRGLTPNFSFPLDTCTFTAEGLDGWRAKTFSNMTQDLRKALRYSPGRTISVDGREYGRGSDMPVSNDPVDGARPYLGDEEARSKHLEVVFTLLKTVVGGFGSVEEGFTGDACPNCGRIDPTDMENHKPIVSRWLRPEGFAPIIIPWKPTVGEASPNARTRRQNKGVASTCNLRR